MPKNGKNKKIRGGISLKKCKNKFYLAKKCKILPVFYAKTAILSGVKNA